MAGRRSMHFANCQGHIQDAAFIGAITSKTFAARNLGSTEAKADLTLPNEIEFSISANRNHSSDRPVDHRGATRRAPASRRPASDQSAKGGAAPRATGRNRSLRSGRSGGIPAHQPAAFVPRRTEAHRRSLAEELRRGEAERKRDASEPTKGGNSNGPTHARPTGASSGNGSGVWWGLSRLPVRNATPSP